MNIITEDLLNATEDIIVHQVNCRGKMGSGIALQIKKKWPQAYKDYMRLFEINSKRDDLLGDVRITMIKNDKENKYIAHLFGQKTYGYDGARYTNYEALYSGLEYIANQAKQFNKSVAIPYYIGCGRGGAEWSIIFSMIKHLFKDVEFTIYMKLEE